MDNESDVFNDLKTICSRRAMDNVAGIWCCLLMCYCMFNKSIFSVHTYSSHRPGYPVCAFAKGLSNRFCPSVCQSVSQSGEKF